jgi:hypothetical protein
MFRVLRYIASILYHCICNLDASGICRDAGTYKCRRFSARDIKLVSAGGPGERCVVLRAMRATHHTHALGSTSSLGSLISAFGITEPPKTRLGKLTRSNRRYSDSDKSMLHYRSANEQ